MIFNRLLVVYGCYFPNHPRKWWVHEQLRKRLGVSICSASTVTRNGLRWNLNPADYAQAGLYWLGEKDFWDLWHLKRLIREGSTIIDAGANYGYYVATLAKSLKNECRILALEPHPDNFQRLRTHVQLNELGDVIDCFEIGVADAPGLAAMAMPQNNSGHARIINNQGTSQVKVVTLDEFSAAQKLDRVDALIIDVEGYEDRALHGAAEILSRHRPLVFIELWPPAFAQQGSRVENAVDILKTHGYSLFKAHRKDLIPLKELPTGDVGIQAFCFHNDSIPEWLA